MSEKNLPFMIYAEITPNPDVMKFVSNHLLMENGNVLEITDPNESAASPLAEKLFSFPFIKSVFLAQNFISITKSDGIEWDDVMLELREYISNYLNAGYDVVSGVESSIDSESDQSANADDHAQAESPTEERIVEILDEYVRPAVEGDGGAIHFKSFEDGKLNVLLKGACSGCPSSSVTLKAGIQALFEKMLPEVKEVVAEEV